MWSVLIKHIGTGHFSLVCEAYDRQTKRTIALKFFSPKHTGDPYRQLCFKREAELLKEFVGCPDILQWVAPIDSFSIPIVTSVCEIEISFPFYATARASSDAQSAVMLNHWTLIEKIERFRAMCRAVRRVHTVGIVHRDIKLSNFLIDRDDTMLCDFGTARCLTDGSEPIAGPYFLPVGDTSYSAPELFAGVQEVDASTYYKSDLYALGATFFELITGTILNVQLFDESLISDLIRTMNVVSRNQRVRIYDDVVSSLSTGRPLPRLLDFVPELPRSVLGPLNCLYVGLCAIDYRQRLQDFERIFSYIRQAEIILKNESAYQAWRRRRELYRQNADKKRDRRLNTTIGVVA